jgi:hypothetical protein
MTRTELPRVLVYMAAMICGVLAAMAAQILLARAGADLADMWRHVLSAQTAPLRAVGPWWLMVASAFLVSIVVAAVLSRTALPWHGFRLLRWVAGAAVVFALAEVGHIAAVTGGGGGGTHAAVTLGTLCVAALVALFGAHFAMRR